MLFGRDKSSMITAEDALPGRGETMPVPTQHHVNGAPLTPTFPEGTEQINLGMGCFWGVERIFWQLEGVVPPSAGYASGSQHNPTSEVVGSGTNGHTPAWPVVFEPAKD